MGTDNAFKVALALHAHGYEAFYVGGAVRDAVLGVERSDVDIATNATPPEVQYVCQQVYGWSVYPVGEKWGTMLVMVGDDGIEVTTYRSEGRYTDMRHPDKVQFEEDILMDLSRRDFTWNAMAFDPINGVIIDKFHGQEDLNRKIIRAVGDPMERFMEDPLRIMRMCRFAGRFGFTVERDTWHASIRRAPLLKHISGERIRDELFKALDTDVVEFALMYLDKSGAFDAILPEVMALRGIKQPKKFHAFTVMDHVFETVKYIPRGMPLLRFVALVHDIGKARPNPDPPPYFPEHVKIGLEMLDDIVDRFKFSNAEEYYIRFMVKHHMDVYIFLRDATDRSFRRYLSRIGDDVGFLDDLFTLVRADINGSGRVRPFHLLEVDDFQAKLKRIQEEKPPLSRGDLNITGNDLLLMGIEPSARMSRIFKTLLDEVLENPDLNDVIYLQKRALEIR